MTAPPVRPPIEVAVVERPIGLRVGLRRLSLGLLVYGAVGLALAIIGLLAMLYVGGRVGDMAERTSDQMETLIATVDDASVALTDAGATAGSFATTLDRTPDTVRQAAQTVRGVRDSLFRIEDTLGSISILGNQPFDTVSAQFGQIAEDLLGLDARLEAIANSLEDNSTKLRENASSLTNLGSRLGQVADQLRTGIVQDSLDDVRVTVTVFLLVLVVWTAVPAVGALVLGFWLRRLVGVDGAGVG
jgi:hypothetical protein